ncbi:hypothetical protein KKD42_02775 [Patescibacteria group bacterium]|nr:hypothetical protein [Patescibacteria group bacterium]
MKQKFKTRLLSAITAVATIGTVFLSASSAQAVSPTSVSDTLTREKISEFAYHTIRGTFTGGNWTLGRRIFFNYDHGTFSLGNSTNLGCQITNGSGTCSAIQSSPSMIVTAICDSGPCWGDLEITNVTGTNPGLAGSYVIEITSEAGVNYASDFAIPIVDDDQVTVSATVDPLITFNVGNEGGGVGCSPGFTGNGGTVALGVLPVNTLVSSDGSVIDFICTRVSTNATNGAVVTVSSTYSGLQSTSVPADIIPSDTETLSTAGGSSASQGYGLCAGTSLNEWGMDTTMPAGNMPTSTTPYNGNSMTCDPTSLDVGLVDGTAREIVQIAGPVGNAYTTIYVKAIIDSTQPAHNDYTDTLTFIATGTF